jgi:hypothetical protein
MKPSRITAPAVPAVDHHSLQTTEKLKERESCKTISFFCNSMFCVSNGTGLCEREYKRYVLYSQPAFSARQYLYS